MMQTQVLKKKESLHWNLLSEAAVPEYYYNTLILDKALPEIQETNQKTLQVADIKVSAANTTQC